MAAHSLGAAGQQSAPSPQPTGAISGVVVDGASGGASADVVVSLSGSTLPPGYPVRQLSDARGRFAFMNVPDGSYLVATSRFGFLDGGYGRDGGPADSLRPIVIENGDVAAGLRAPIWRPAMIAGTVRDEAGEPVVGVFVRALRRIRIASRDELATGPVTVTDDRGQYRLSGLVAGRYVIQVPSVQASVAATAAIRPLSASAPDGVIEVDANTRLFIGRYPLPPPRDGNRSMTYGITYHPSASALALAVNLDVAAGDQRAAVDVALTPVSAVRVAGTIDAPADALVNLTVRLLSAGLENLGNGSEVATASVAGDGTFAFFNVPAGTYTLDASTRLAELMATGSRISSSPGARGGALPQPPTAGSWGWNSYNLDGLPGLSLEATTYRSSNAPNYSGRMPVSVDTSDVTGIRFPLRAGETVRGRMVIETDPAALAPPAPPRFTLALEHAGDQPILGLTTVNVTAGAEAFEVTGVAPGAYWIRATSPAGWLIKSAHQGDRDVTRAPLDVNEASGAIVVTMTNAVPTLTGRVRTSDGGVPAGGVVIAFPVSAPARTDTGLLPARLKSTVMQANGAFRFTTLPAGDYFVAAIEAARAANWRDPALLAALERTAARVTLTWGQAAVRDLTMAVSR